MLAHLKRDLQSLRSLEQCVGVEHNKQMCTEYEIEETPLCFSQNLLILQSTRPESTHFKWLKSIEQKQNLHQQTKGVDVFVWKPRHNWLPRKQLN